MDAEASQSGPRGDNRTLFAKTPSNTHPRTGSLIEACDADDRPHTRFESRRISRKNEQAFGSRVRGSLRVPSKCAECTARVSAPHVKVACPGAILDTDQHGVTEYRSIPRRTSHFYRALRSVVPSFPLISVAFSVGCSVTP